MFKKRVLIIFFVFLSIYLIGCIKQDVSVDNLWDLARMSNKKSVKEVYLLENDVYTPYLILDDDYEGTVLLLRKEIMSKLRSFNDYSAKYEGSFIDVYLSSEYLSAFSKDVKENLVSVNIEVVSEEALYIGGEDTYTISRKAFLLSYTEVDYSELLMAPMEGEALSYYSDDESRIAYRENTPCGWWLRTPYTGYGNVTWSVGEDGMKTELSTEIENGVRPAICLSKETKIVQSTRVLEGQKVYVIE